MVSTCMQGGVCGQLMLGAIRRHQWPSVVISGHQWPDLRLRHRVALIVDDLDALWHALIHLLVLLLLVARALRIDETRAQPLSTAIRGHQLQSEVINAH